MAGLGGLQPMQPLQPFGDISQAQQPLAQVQAPGAAGLGATIAIALSNQHRIAQNQQLAAQQQQLQQLAIKQQKLQMGQQLYAQLGQQVATKPELAGDQGLLKQAMEIQKATGVAPAWTKDANGNTVLDVNLLMPAPDVQTMAPDKQMDLYNKLIAMPVEDRKPFVEGNKIRGVPPGWLTAPQYDPLKGTSMTGLLNDVIGPKGAVAQFESGAMTPTMFAGTITAAKGALGGTGIALDQYTTPEFLQSGISQWATQQLDWLKTRGIVAQENAATRRKVEENQGKEAVARLTLQGRQLTEHIREFDAGQARLWQTHIDNMGIAERRLNDQETALRSLVENRTVLQSLGLVKALSAPVNDLRSQYNAAQSTLAGVTKAMQSAANQGYTPSKQLQDQFDSLTSRVNELEPQLKYYDKLLHRAGDSAYSGIAGTPVRAVSHTATTTPTGGGAQAMGGYKIGTTYGSGKDALKYLGGDPDSRSSWASP